MDSISIAKLQAKIKERHQGDEKQLEVIFSPTLRILVEAPAGYGKTNTMVSKIAYMLASQQIPNPKKLLALTFSVNAAYKIKKDATQQVPELLAGTGIDVSISDKVYVSNYHGFCRNVLRKYGWKINPLLIDIDKFQSLDDSETKKVMQTVDGIAFDKADLLSNYNTALKNIDGEFLKKYLHDYNNTVIQDLIPKKIIPYNAILSLTILLFINYPIIRKFYQKYFTCLLVDEYQDTNTLSYWLITYLLTDETKLVLMGDSLQRIYGFIGAVPNLMASSEQTFGMAKVQLEKNYRFSSNRQMLLLDSVIRRNAENPFAPKIVENALIELHVAENQDNEAIYVVQTALELISRDDTCRVAILVKQRGKNIDRIIQTFEQRRIPYFYGLFSDEDLAYVNFHKKCLYEFIELIKLRNQITKKLSQQHIFKIKELLEPNSQPLVASLLELLDLFWSKIFSDYAYLSNDDKISLVKDTFEHNGLKQFIEFVNTRITISTVHAAKGLEWEYVILPDMEQDLFPNWFGMCKSCTCKPKCDLIITKENEKQFLEELSVFYVAVTRARRHVFFSASRLQLDASGNLRRKNLSCFMRLPGIRFS